MSTNKERERAAYFCELDKVFGRIFHGQRKDQITITSRPVYKNPHAVALGRLGGKANKGIPKPKSAENGKKGGRPKKSLKAHAE